MKSGSSSRTLAGRRVTVMGLGLFGGGAAAARFLVREGADVTVTDLRDRTTLAAALVALEGLPVHLELGRHREQDFTETDLVVANPAVPPRSAFLALARSAGVPITSEVALFLERAPARVIAVTGTQGKSTTCHLLAGLLRAAGLRVRLGGNIGRSLLDELAELGTGDVCVLELSSYQLEALPDELGGARPLEAAAIVNVLSDHLERHGDRAGYARAKGRMLELVRPGGACLLGPGTEEMVRPAGVRTLGLDTLELRIDVASRTFRLGDEVLASFDDLALPGEFQRVNALAALGLARLAGADITALGPGLRALGGLPHRLEQLAPVRGHAIWDNGVSTTPDSTVSALAALEPGLTLICGGAPKGLPLDELVTAARERARRVIVFGAAAQAWCVAFEAAGVQVRSCPDVPAAVDAAFEWAEAGEPLLFSPAAASFDAYPNFLARAEDFRRALAAHANSRDAAREPV